MTKQTNYINPFKQVKTEGKVIFSPFPTNLLEDQYAPSYTGIELTYENGGYGVTLLAPKYFPIRLKSHHEKLAKGHFRYLADLYLSDIKQYASKVIGYIGNKPDVSYPIAKNEQGQSDILVVCDENKEYWMVYPQANHASNLGYGFEGRELTSDIIVSTVAKNLTMYLSEGRKPIGATN